MGKATWINIGGTWKQVKNVWQNIGGLWKQKVIPKGNINGIWKEFISYIINWSLIIDDKGYSNVPKIVVDNKENLYIKKYIGSYYIDKYSPEGSLVTTKLLGDSINLMCLDNDFIYMCASGNIYKTALDLLNIETIRQLGGSTYFDFFKVDTSLDRIFLIRDQTFFVYKLSVNALVVQSSSFTSNIIKIEGDCFYLNTPFWNYSTNYYSYKIQKYNYITRDSSQAWATSEYVTAVQGQFSCIGCFGDYIYCLWRNKTDGKYYFIKLNKNNGSEEKRMLSETYIDFNLTYVVDENYNFYTIASGKLIKYDNNFVKISETDIGLSGYTSTPNIEYRNGYIYYTGNGGSSTYKGIKIGRIYVR